MLHVYCETCTISSLYKHLSTYMYMYVQFAQLNSGKLSSHICYVTCDIKVWTIFIFYMKIPFFKLPKP